ncbi:MAG: mannose-1-phosphate guanylyltransferase [Oscillospiraceae bacterium]
MKITALIMAGGRGERFWPKSRRSMPKQFLCLSDNGKTMIQLTVARIKSIVAYEDIFIVTNQEYYDLAVEQLPEIPRENILCEPFARNTAPCVGLGAMHIKKKYGDALMITLPSDHLIKYQTMFLNVLTDACGVAEKDQNLATVGIPPTYPEISYGYVKFNPNKSFLRQNRAFEVERFEEKPTLRKAKEYLSNELYLWNSGMFVWKASSILSKIEEYLPAIYTGLTAIGDAIGTENYQNVMGAEFTKMPSESIDYGVLEKTKNIYIIPGAFGWDDVGSWLSVERIRKSNEFGNVVTGNVITVNTKNSIIECNSRLIATVGIEDLVIVDTNDATLICAKDSTADIKKVLENLKICNRDEYI